ncbi:Uncharacterised protein [Bordetella pertussis]|nr:Uncharacterised protein [Bordetella pertussis]
MIEFAARLRLDIVGDGKGDRGQRGGHDAEVVGVPHQRRQVGDGVQRQHEVAQRAVYDAARPLGGGGVLHGEVQPQRLFERLAARAGGMAAQFAPEAPVGIGVFVSRGGNRHVVSRTGWARRAAPTGDVCILDCLAGEGFNGPARRPGTGPA